MTSAQVDRIVVLTCHVDGRRLLRLPLELVGTDFVIRTPRTGAEGVDVVARVPKAWQLRRVADSLIVFQSVAISVAVGEATPGRCDFARRAADRIQDHMQLSRTLTNASMTDQLDRQLHNGTPKSTDTAAVIGKTWRLFVPIKPLSTVLYGGHSMLP